MLLMLLLSLILVCTAALTPSQITSRSVITMSTQPKQNWDLGRFIRTASYFESIRFPFLPNSPGKDRVKLSAGSTLWQSENPNKTIEWGPLDDVVMGGASKSALEIGGNFNGTWQGFVTTANNGGFAGIRTKLLRKPFDLSTCKGFSLTVVGDGQRYKFIARDDADWNGVAWSFSFDTTKDKLTTIKVPFDSLKPTLFARVLPNIKQYDKSCVTAMQVTLSKFEYDGQLNPKFKEGPFALQIKSISTF